MGILRYCYSYTFKSIFCINVCQFLQFVKDEYIFLCEQALKLKCFVCWGSNRPYAWWHFADQFHHQTSHSKCKYVPRGQELKNTTMTRIHAHTEIEEGQTETVRERKRLLSYYKLKRLKKSYINEFKFMRGVVKEIQITVFEVQNSAIILQFQYTKCENKFQKWKKIDCDKVL